LSKVADVQASASPLKRGFLNKYRIEIPPYRGDEKKIKN
jgi:hypothetical protein